MNWGYKILSVYLLFVIGIVFLVFKATNEQVDLVTTDYYAKELRYQENIDNVKRTNALSMPVNCELLGQQLSINFPKYFVGKTIKGGWVMYCPSDEKKDVHKDFVINELSLQINIPKHSKGLYVLQLSWQTEGLNYYFEKKISL